MLIRRKPIEIGSLEITREMKIYGCCGFSFLVMALSGVMVKLLWVMIYSAVVCLLHMLLRPRSVSSKTDKIYEDMKSGGAMWTDPENPGDADHSRKKQQSTATSFFTMPGTGKQD